MATFGRIQVRRGNSDDWALANPILAPGEPGVNLTTKGMKVGDGVTRWNALPYITGAGSGGGGVSVNPISFDTDDIPYLNDDAGDPDSGIFFDTDDIPYIP